jgi:hypothetical protein
MGSDHGQAPIVAIPYSYGASNVAKITCSRLFRSVEFVDDRTYGFDEVGGDEIWGEVWGEI